MMLAARKPLGLEARETIIIGHTMNTEILEGLLLVYTTIVTFSGVSTKGSLVEYTFKPNFIIISLTDMELE